MLHVQRVKRVERADTLFFPLIKHIVSWSSRSSRPRVSFLQRDVFNSVLKKNNNNNKNNKKGKLCSYLCMFNTFFLFCKYIVFPAQTEYSYFLPILG